MLSDLRYAFRGILRRPGHTFLVVFTLALGLGINTVAFSSVNALVFRPFTIPNAESFGWIFISDGANPYANASRETYDTIRTSATTLDSVVAEGRLPLSAQSAAGPEQIWALVVSPNYFSVVQAPMRAGRVLSEWDGTADAVPVVISERYWKTRWNATDDLSSIRPVLNGQDARVLGVVRDDHQGPGGIYEPHVWLAFDALPALRLNPDAGVDATWLTMMARPKAGVPATLVSAEITALARGLTAPDGREGVRAVYVPVADGHPEARQLGAAAAVAMAVVGLVLLIACFNVAGLILARSVERQQELGLRAALGAGRGRLTRLLFAEGLIVATLAGAAALLLASWSEALLGGLSLPAPIPQRLHFTTDWRMVAFTLVLVMVAAIVPTLTPLWRIVRVDPIRWLKAGSTGAVGGLAPARARRVFVVLQVVGSTAFLTLALMFVISFVAALRTETGFNTTQTAAMQIPAARASALLERLAARPEIAAVAAAERISFHVGDHGRRRVWSDGQPCEGDACPTMPMTAITPTFFDVLQIPVISGRSFTATDTDTVIVNDTAAAALWPDQNPLGRWLSDAGDRRPLQVVGVVRTVITGMMSEKPQPYIYLPWNPGQRAETLTLVARARTNGQAAATALRDTWTDLDNNVAPATVQTLQERMALPLWPSRVSAAFFATCGLVAVILVTVGLFGVTYQVVSQRTREFGVRLALGATAQDLRRMVFGESLRLAAPGLVIGLMVAAAAASAASSMLVGVSALDPRVYLAAVTLQLAVTMLAAWVPALRASRVSPHTTMRAE